MSGPQPGDVLIVPTRAAADRLQRVIAAANAMCDSLADAHAPIRDLSMRMLALRDALVAAGMREEGR